MMGTRRNIGYDTFPKQGKYLGKRVNVCFHYDTSKTIEGVIVRDDIDPPYLEIIRLDDGRHVLTTECMWQPID